MFFFFFKQKTAYEMLRSLVGSEMCIRDSSSVVRETADDLEIDRHPIQHAQSLETIEIPAQIADVRHHVRGFAKPALNLVERDVAQQRQQRVYRLGRHAKLGELAPRNVLRLALELVDDTKDGGRLLVADAERGENGAEQTSIGHAGADVARRQPTTSHRFDRQCQE